MRLESIKIKKNDILNHYQQNGWVKIENFFNKNEVSDAKKKINNFLKLNFKKYKGRDINFTGNKKKFTQINSFHRLHDFTWVKKKAFQNKILNIVKTLLSSKAVELRASELFAKPKKSGLRVPIHQDNYYWNVIGGNALTLWIALSPSLKENGALFYFNKSHKMGILEHKPSFSKGSSQTIKNKKMLKRFKKIYPILKTGDALLHNCLIVHGSTRNRSKISRKGFTFQFKTKKSKYDYVKIKEYEKKLNYQIKLRDN